MACEGQHRRGERSACWDVCGSSPAPDVFSKTQQQRPEEGTQEREATSYNEEEGAEVVNLVLILREQPS